MFRPQINEHSKALFSFPGLDERLVPQAVSESLYNNATERSIQQQLSEDRARREVKRNSNKSHIRAQSEKYLRKSLLRDIKRLFDVLDVTERGFLGVTHTLLILQHFGLLPDVLLMNLEEGSKARNFVTDIWKLVKSREYTNAAGFDSISALVLATILDSSKRKSIAPQYLKQLNVSKEEDKQAANQVIDQLRVNYASRSPGSQFVGFKLHKDLEKVEDHEVEALKNKYPNS